MIGNPSTVVTKGFLNAGESGSEMTWFQRNQKAIMIGGAILIAGLLLLPDALIRKYVPFVK